MVRRTLLLAGFASLILTLMGSFVLAPQKASALSGSDFNAARIIEDGIFFNSGAMNTGDIQNFLNSKVANCQSGYTCLKNYSQSFGTVAANTYCGGITGGSKSAANIIFDVSRACGINPQVLIVLLQKEQGLIMDDAPTDTQYRIATGYGCPDTAPCDAEYYGFFNQVYNAGKQFKRYTMQPNLFNYAAGRTSYILYNPSSSCGGSNVTIQNAATAALYNYTPYQPNAAALAVVSNSSPGGTVSCGAYGNRNFWWFFNKWFGPSVGDSYTLAMNIDDQSQWVIYRGIKQYVPSAEIKEAWGLPDQAIAMSGSYLAGIPEGPWLGRLFTKIGEPALYFADGGKKYYIPTQDMKKTWGLDSQIISSVSAELWDEPENAGFLSYSVKKASSPALYMMDGLNGSSQMVLRQYAGPDVFHAWEGDVANIVTLSDTYFDQIDNAVGSTLTGYTVKGASTSEQYHVISGQKLYLSGAMSSVFNQTYQTVGDQTVNRLITSAPVTNFIRLPGNGVTIYMVNGGEKLPVSSPDVLRAWSPNGVVGVNILNNGFLNLLTTGTMVSGYEADVGGQLYLMDGKKYTVPTELDAGYRTGTIATVSSALMNLYSTATATGFIKGAGPSIYLVDQGSRKHIASIESWQLWNGSRNEAVTTVSDAALSQLSNGGQINHYFSVGSTNYVIDNGTYRSVSGSVATDWGLSSPVAVNAATRSRFSDGGALQNKVKVGSTYYRIKYGKRHATTDLNLANVWGVDSSPTQISDTLVSRVQSGPSLNIFAKSTNEQDKRIFLVDNGGTSFYHIVSIEQFLNYGYNGGDIVAVAPSDLGTVSEAKNIIKTSDSSSERVVDGGSKRDFSNSTVRARWLDGTNALTVSSGLYNRLPNNVTVGGNVKGGAPNVYTVDAGLKRWIQSGGTYQTYAAQYGSFSGVSDWLLAGLPTGADIP